MTIFVVGNNLTQVSDADTDVHMAIYRALSYTIQGWQAIRAKKIRENPGSMFWRNWDGVKSAYMMKNQVFATGLLPVIQPILLRAGIQFSIMDNRKMCSFPEIPDEIRLADGKDEIVLRDYQLRVVKDFFALGEGRGVAKCATGAGKTECAIAITKYLCQPTLFLTHRVNLLAQTAKRFAIRMPEMARHIGMVGGGCCDPQRITVATVQTLQSMIKQDARQAAKLLGEFRLLIVDEAHRSGASQFYEPAHLCKNACCRLGLTATPFMRNHSGDDLSLLGITGPIFCEVKNSELIARGIMAKPMFAFFNIKEPDGIKSMRNWHDIYDKGIVQNAARNGIIMQQAVRLVKQMHKKVLCIVDKIEHGRLLESMLQGAGLVVDFVSGKTSAYARELSLKKLSDGKIDLLLSTNIFDEGIDVPEIDALILASGNKSPVSFFQRIGRSTRQKEKDNYSIIVDFIDMQHDKLYEHSRIRYNYAASEDGFVIL